MRVGIETWELGHCDRIGIVGVHIKGGGVVPLENSGLGIGAGCNWESAGSFFGTLECVCAGASEEEAPVWRGGMLPNQNEGGRRE